MKEAVMSGTGYIVGMCVCVCLSACSRPAVWHSAALEPSPNLMCLHRPLKRPLGRRLAASLAPHSHTFCYLCVSAVVERKGNDA